MTEVSDTKSRLNERGHRGKAPATAQGASKQRVLDLIDYLEGTPSGHSPEWWQQLLTELEATPVQMAARE